MPIRDHGTPSDAYECDECGPHEGVTMETRPHYGPESGSTARLVPVCDGCNQVIG